MIELEIAKTKGNRYRIIADVDRFVQLECVWFCAREDLGDQIFCECEGQKLWVAKFHSSRMKLVEE